MTITFSHDCNYLARLRREKFGQSTIHLGELEKLLIENSAVTEKVADAFVIGYDINYYTNAFKFFMFSIILLKTALKSKHLHVDATYKLLWQGFPVHVMGTTDRNRSFHCYGISVCNGETTAYFEFTFHTMKFAIAKYNWYLY